MERARTTGEDPIAQYLEDIGKVPLLTKEQEYELGEQMKAGREAQELLESGEELTRYKQRKLAGVVEEGQQARETMIVSNLRLVVSLAKRYTKSGMELADLIDEGNEGLFRAVDKFDHLKGFKFSTYATWWIRQSIQRGIANKSRAIRLPVHVHDNFARLSKAQYELYAKHEREPTITEIAEYMEISEKKVNELLHHRNDILSLNMPTGENEDVELSDFITDPNQTPPDESVFNEDIINFTYQILDQYCQNERERQIIIMRFGLDGEKPMTLEQVGNTFGLTRERIRQVEQTVLRRLKHIPGLAEQIGSML